ncbi:futalosine hydrolase [Streptomyces phytohabitans]|uniref:futalosine hydrolase n=1 Tax=Streptomyces phytohabitans TaxID=1150371 RepID=UPI00345BAC31
MRVLTVTAVAAERDAVVRAFAAPPDAGPDAGATPARVRLPGGPTAHRVRVSAAGTVVELDAVAAGVGTGAAAAGTATALTAAALGGTPYDLVVSAGIGGGFAGGGLPEDGTAGGDGRAGGPVPGAIVVASVVVAADLGAQTAEPGGFVPVTELGFGTVTHLPPPALVRAVAAATGAVTGPVLTVSTVTGTAARAAELAARHPGAAVEAMEGFGVAEAAAAHGVPVLELRTVSNPVGPRDRAAWRVPDALRALTTAYAAAVPALADWHATRRTDEAYGTGPSHRTDEEQHQPDEQGQAERA